MNEGVFLTIFNPPLSRSTKPIEINEIKPDRIFFPGGVFYEKSLIDRGLKADIIPIPNTLCHFVDGIALT